MTNKVSDQDFKLFSSLIYNQSGIHFSSMNRAILENRLKERLKEQNLTDLQSYYHLILTDNEEMKILLDSVTTNLTRFFRNAGHFQTLEKYVLPDLVAYKYKQRNPCLKVWSAGCSTGEEPLSIAIILKEKLPPNLRSEIIASDISLQSLMKAQEGFFTDNKAEGVPKPYLDKYFEEKHKGYQIKETIKSMVKFDYHNLKFDSGLRNVDILFCRNVIIYFDEAAQKAVINRFWNIMSSHSYLFLGHSESLFGMNTKFEFLKTDWACIYRKFIQ